MRVRIVEEFWGINRRTGERSTRQTDEKTFMPVVGSIMEMPTGRRKFSVDVVDEDSVTVTVFYENNPTANKTMLITKGDSVVYRPVSRDGGYKYTIFYEDEINH